MPDETNPRPEEIKPRANTEIAAGTSFDDQVIHPSNPLETASLPPSDPQFLAFLFAGPLPPPAILQQYETIVPGSAKKIIENAHSQTKHRQRLEATVIEGGVRHERLGVIIGGTVSVVAIVTGGIVAALGAPTAGATIATAIVIGLVGVFVYGTDSRRRERKEKDERKKKNSPERPPNESKDNVPA